MEASQGTWKEYREVVRVSRNEIKKAKAHLEFNLAKDNKEGFPKHINSKRKNKDKLNGRENPGN